MITLSDIRAVGKLLKPHGISGEIVVQLDVDVDLSEPRCVILDIDGIFVPFFVSNVRPKSSETDLVTIDGITDEKMAAALCGKTLYLLQTDFDSLAGGDDEEGDGGFYADDLVGFSVASVDGSLEGKVVAIDTTTENYLFIIETPSGKRVFVPVADEFIALLDPETRRIEFDLPEGLLDL